MDCQVQLYDSSGFPTCLLSRNAMPSFVGRAPCTKVDSRALCTNWDPRAPYTQPHQPSASYSNSSISLQLLTMPYVPQASSTSCACSVVHNVFRSFCPNPPHHASNRTGNASTMHNTLCLPAVAAAGAAAQPDPSPSGAEPASAGCQQAAAPCAAGLPA
ncbi:hypothetical protein HaLaN_23640, partial [Haematococcus lacustris]